jgi:hypothetical protein
MNSAVRDGPHPRQALDEGRVRVAVEKRLQIGVNEIAPLAGHQGLGGKLLDQPRPRSGAGHVEALDFCHGDGVFGEGLGRAHAWIGFRQPADDEARLGVAQLVGSGEQAQENEAGLGLHVDAALQRRKEGREQIAQAGETARLIDDDLAPPADEQADVDVDLGLDLHRAQVWAGSRQIGDGRGVTRVGLVLAAACALPRAIDREAWRVDDF